jgi:putative tryptophan/tyrosine transport system substrate-binding protein
MQFEQLNRREFMTLLGSAAAVWPVAARTQQQAMPVIGFLNGQSPNQYAYYVDAFRQALNAGGFVEGRNVTIEYRWAQGEYDKLPALAADLVRRQVTVIAATGTTAAVVAAKAATATIPIIFTTGGDPVKAGLVPNLNRPGGNITGISFLVNETGSKQVELLCEMVPSASSVGLLVNPANPNTDDAIADVLKAARVLGRQVRVVNARSEREIDAAFATFTQQRVNAIIQEADALFLARNDQMIALAARHALPAIYSLREQAAAGGLMSYGASQVDAYRQAGVYTARVLKGEKPGDLPAMLPTKFEFVINLKTAKALGIEVPPGLSARANEVIE